MPIISVVHFLSSRFSSANRGLEKGKDSPASVDSVEGGTVIENVKDTLKKAQTFYEPMTNCVVLYAFAKKSADLQEKDRIAIEEHIQNTCPHVKAVLDTVSAAVSRFKLN